MKSLSLASVLAAILLFAAPVSAVPYLWVDFPQGGTVGTTMQIYGTALNSDVVHIWAFPNGVGHFVGAVYPVEASVQRQLETGTFSMIARNLPIGTYPLVFYAHDAATGTFPTQVVQTVTVRACVMSTVNWWFYGPSGQTTVPLPYCA